MRVLKKSGERGAIVVEATISLSVFIFTMFTILSVVDICYIQSKIGMALDSATKELAQYSYLYYKLGADKMEAKWNEGTGDARDVTKDTVDGVVNIMDSLSGASHSASTGDFDGLMNAIDSGVGSVDSLCDTYADKIADNPKEFIIGLGKMAGNDLKEKAKSALLAKCVGRGLMKKNLKSSKDDDPDAFLKRYRVVNGIKGLDFKYSSLMAYGESSEIQLVCTYKVKVIRLLNIDFEFKFRQMAKTTAWGNGVSLIKKETPKGTNIWDITNDLSRGKEFVKKEKEKFTYTDSRHGFDAYVPSENKFVSIISRNTHLSSNDTAEELKRSFNKPYNDMKGKVSKLSDKIVVKDKSGKDVTFTSNASTRKYVIRVVVPDDSDMKMVKQAKQQFENSHPDAKVEIVTGYGSPTPEKSEKEKSS